MTDRKLLVTGAGGQLGRRVVELLLDRGGATVIAVTRDPSKIADLARRGADVRRADFDDAASLASAFAGADRALLVSTDTVDGTDRRVQQHVAAIRALAGAKVKHVAYTSVVNPKVGAAALVSDDHRRTEEALASSALPYTALRNNLYVDLALGAFAGAIAHGKLVDARGTGRVSLVTREDCARAAAAALADDFQGTRTLDITGPEAVSSADVAEVLSALSGKTVTYVPVSAEQATAGLVSHGLPEPVAKLLVSFDVAIARGELSVVSPAVLELTGKKPESVKDFLGRHRSALGIG